LSPTPKSVKIAISGWTLPIFTKSVNYPWLTGPLENTTTALPDFIFCGNDKGLAFYVIPAKPVPIPIREPESKLHYPELLRR